MVTSELPYTCFTLRPTLIGQISVDDPFDNNDFVEGEMKSHGYLTSKQSTLEEKRSYYDISF